MNIALGAIVRNEAEYLLEWIAWHKSLGFSHFFIADNESDDGTYALLQKLEARGIVRLRREPRGERAQIKAYNAMLKSWGGDVERIAFLDADEFLVSSDGRNPIEHLEHLIAPIDVGAIAINWRMFGSSGQQHRADGLVIERFTRCAPDDHAVCRHIKTYAKRAAIAKQRIHRADLVPGFRYLDTAGRDVAFEKPGGAQPAHDGELSKNIGPGLLRVHHYAVKSLQEYTEKKQFRGDAMSGPGRDRGLAYFRSLDLNDNECLAASAQAASARQALQKLELTLGRAPRSRLHRLWTRLRRHFDALP